MTYFAGNCIKGYFLLSLIIVLCTGYVHRVNSKYPADDPQKRDYPFTAVLLSLFAWPLFILASISLFILKAIAYGVFLIIFTVVMIFFRKPILFKWLDKIATKIGTMFLKANTYLIRAFFPPLKPKGVT